MRAPSSERAGALERDRGDADGQHDDPGGAHERLQRTAISAPVTAAMTGTPAGATGISSSAIPPPSSGGVDGRARAQLSGEQREEERREHRVEPVGLRVAQAPAAEHAQGRAAGPRDQQHQRGAEEAAAVDPAVALGDGERLVDGQLRLRQPARAAAAQRRRDRHADRQIAQVEQDGGDDRGGQRPALIEHRDRGELRRAGERREREHERRDDAHAGVAREDPEGHAERRRRDRDRHDLAGAGRHRRADADRGDFRHDGRSFHFDGTTIPIGWNFVQ